VKEPGTRPSFWTGGPAEYLKALHAQRDEQLEPLQAQLEAATDASDVARLEDSIARLRRRYEAESKKIDESLFW